MTIRLRWGGLSRLANRVDTACVAHISRARAQLTVMVQRPAGEVGAQPHVGVDVCISGGEAGAAVADGGQVRVAVVRIEGAVVAVISNAPG